MIPKDFGIQEMVDLHTELENKSAELFLKLQYNILQKRKICCEIHFLREQKRCIENIKQEIWDLENGLTNVHP